MISVPPVMLVLVREPPFRAILQLNDLTRANAAPDAVVATYNQLQLRSLLTFSRFLFHLLFDFLAVAVQPVVELGQFSGGQFFQTGSLEFLGRHFFLDCARLLFGAGEGGPA